MSTSPSTALSSTPSTIAATTTATNNNDNIDNKNRNQNREKKEKKEKVKKENSSQVSSGKSKSSSSVAAKVEIPLELQNRLSQALVWEEGVKVGADCVREFDSSGTKYFCVTASTPNGDPELLKNFLKASHHHDSPTSVSLCKLILSPGNNNLLVAAFVPIHDTTDYTSIINPVNWAQTALKGMEVDVSSSSMQVSVVYSSPYPSTDIESSETVQALIKSFLEKDDEATTSETPVIKNDPVQDDVDIDLSKLTLPSVEPTMLGSLLIINVQGFGESGSSLQNLSAIKEKDKVYSSGCKFLISNGWVTKSKDDDEDDWVFGDDQLGYL